MLDITSNYALAGLVAFQPETSLIGKTVSVTLQITGGVTPTACWQTTFNSIARSCDAGAVMIRFSM